MAVQHLMLISLGPVQDFITSARRCQDLWFGSWLLSDLAAEVARSLAHGDNTLVFPGALGNDKQNVANKILVKLSADAQGTKEAATQARAAMVARLESIRDVTFRGLKGNKFFANEMAKQQLDDLIEFHWVALPLPKVEDYEAVRQQLEALLMARKNSRLWEAVSWTADPTVFSGVPKSSLDGMRESVIKEEAFEKLTPAQRRSKFGIRPTERLCAVGLLKRLGVEVSLSDEDERRQELFRQVRPTFHSTSHVASAPLILRMKDSPKARSAFVEYLNQLRELGLDTRSFRTKLNENLSESKFRSPFDNTDKSASRTFPEGTDGHLTFESRLESAFEERSLRADQPVDLDQVKKAQGALGKLLKAIGSTPSPYYALLLADGDSMGKAIDQLAKGAAGLQHHQAFSKVLDGFATAAVTLVAGHGGSLIYSGGDDVLAMVPLHGALACARALHDDFGKRLKELVPVGTPTLSVGIAIAHHLEPFGEARALAKRAEVAAKAHPGKDALAVIVSPRSGTETVVVGGWSNRNPIDTRLLEFVGMLGRGELSSKAAHDLLGTIAPLKIDLKAADRESLRDVVVSLARRVLAAKRLRGGGEILDASVRARLGGRLDGKSSDPFQEVESLANELIVAMALLPGFVAAFGSPTGLKPENAATEVRS